MSNTITFPRTIEDVDPTWRSWHIANNLDIREEVVRYETATHAVARAAADLVLARIDGDADAAMVTYHAVIRVQLDARRALDRAILDAVQSELHDLAADGAAEAEYQRGEF